MTNPLKILRHSAAELLAIAVCSLFPKAQLVSGEATSLGFYYDFFFPEPISWEQIPFIEERMRDFMRQDLPIKQLEMMRKNAIELFKHHKQDLKVVLLKANVETLVHVCQIGHFYDLAHPSFVATTKQVGVIKLLDMTPLTISLPGRPQLHLTRIQGTAFPDQASLKQFLKMAEAAKERDHRVIGKEMQLFTHLEESCPGCWSWLPKGILLCENLMDWWKKEHQEQDYLFVKTPNLLNKKDGFPIQGPSLRFEAEGPSYPVSTTKAALHAQLYHMKLRSYRELPLRFCESSEFYDQGKEGHFWGLLHSRSFTADTASLFCKPEQVLDELISSLQFIDKTFKIFGFEAHWYLVAKAANPKKVSRSWEESRESLIKALEMCGFNYAQEDEGIALEGPRVELRFKDALGRMWKGPYVCVDLHHPEKYGLHYQGADDRMHLPAMITRSMFGSLERLIALLIEHYAGKLPLWLFAKRCGK
jgi:threonyl-tRNA synthetase